MSISRSHDYTGLPRRRPARYHAYIFIRKTRLKQASSELFVYRNGCVRRLGRSKVLAVYLVSHGRLLDFGCLCSLDYTGHVQPSAHFLLDIATIKPLQLPLSSFWILRSLALGLR